VETTDIGNLGTRSAGTRQQQQQQQQQQRSSSSSSSSSSSNQAAAAAAICTTSRLLLLLLLPPPPPPPLLLPLLLRPHDQPIERHLLQIVQRISHMPLMVDLFFPVLLLDQNLAALAGARPPWTLDHHLRMAGARSF
jgi:hypothetical protein